jgi:hypothetical protein
MFVMKTCICLLLCSISFCLNAQRIVNWSSPTGLQLRTSNVTNKLVVGGMKFTTKSNQATVAIAIEPIENPIFYLQDVSLTSLQSIDNPEVQVDVYGLTDQGKKVYPKFLRFNLRNEVTSKDFGSYLYSDISDRNPLMIIFESATIAGLHIDIQSVTNVHAISFVLSDMLTNPKRDVVLPRDLCTYKKTLAQDVSSSMTEAEQGIATAFVGKVEEVSTIGFSPDKVDQKRVSATDFRTSWGVNETFDNTKRNHLIVVTDGLPNDERKPIYDLLALISGIQDLQKNENIVSVYPVGDLQHYDTLVANLLQINLITQENHTLFTAHCEFVSPDCPQNQSSNSGTQAVSYLVANQLLTNQESMLDWTLFSLDGRVLQQGRPDTPLLPATGMNILKTNSDTHSCHLFVF